MCPYNQKSKNLNYKLNGYHIFNKYISTRRASRIIAPILSLYIHLNSTYVSIHIASYVSEIRHTSHARVIELKAIFLEESITY